MTRSSFPPRLRPLEGDPTPWLREEGPPWVRLGILRDLDGAAAGDPAAASARAEVAAHPLVRECLDALRGWPEPPLRRHNDAKHPIHRLALLADLGVDRSLPGLDGVMAKVLASPARDGGLRTLVADPDTQEPLRMALPCDSPILAGAAQALGYGDDPRVGAAFDALEAVRESDGGWFCHGEWGQLESEWRRRPVSCPVATLHALRALSRLPPGDRRRRSDGAQVILDHFAQYERREGRPLHHFQAGRRFRRAKFPFVWYDALHALDTLTRFDDLRGDRRIRALLDAAIDPPPRDGRFRAGSVWTAYKEHDFGQKRVPSPTITFLVVRVLGRIHGP